MDDALDLLSDSLGQREPDPDENKPVVDKVKVIKNILKLLLSQESGDFNFYYYFISKQAVQSDEFFLNFVKDVELLNTF